MTEGAIYEEDRLFRLTEIDWDTGGEAIPDLPTTLDVWALDEEGAVDVATDELGWCIERCCVEELAQECE